MQTRIVPSFREQTYLQGEIRKTNLNKTHQHGVTHFRKHMEIIKLSKIWKVCNEDFI